MADEPIKDGDVVQSAMHWQKTMMDAVEVAEARLRKAAEGEGTKGAMVESAVLTATSSGYVGAAMNASAEVVSFSVKHATKMMGFEAQGLGLKLDALREQIATSTRKADTGTNRLIFATWALALAALVAAVIGYYATTQAPAPQVIVVQKPD